MFHLSLFRGGDVTDEGLNVNEVRRYMNVRSSMKVYVYEYSAMIWSLSCPYPDFRYAIIYISDILPI